MKKSYDSEIILALNDYRYTQNLILVESCIIYFSLKRFFDYGRGGGTKEGNFSCCFVWNLWVYLMFQLDKYFKCYAAIMQVFLIAYVLCYYVSYDYEPSKLLLYMDLFMFVCMHVWSWLEIVVAVMLRRKQMQLVWPQLPL